MTIVGYTTGVYDLFHIGHLNILKNAKLSCDYLIVGVTTDDLCEGKKGKKPVIPFSERLQIVESIKFVDKVVPQSSYDKFDAWSKLNFCKLFVGDDWKGTPQWNQLEVQFSAVGVEIVYFPYTLHTSSTKLRQVIDMMIS